ncbi:S9 family peptidase [Paraglaciecola sp. 2405UD69-4]|uniref:S9 family peptidase n=1 Tax=Paraglaciecola sp. 2405UD69-4 TaxID=3391836 RepID=UPI0039C8DAD3
MNKLSKLVLLSTLICQPFLIHAEAIKSKVKSLSYKDIFELEYATSPLFTPDSQQIIYERKSNNIMNDRTHSSFWRYDIKNKLHRPLIAEASNVTQPVISPDGKKLAYISNRSGSQQLYVRYLDTNEDALLTNSQYKPNNVVWSPDSSQLAFKQFTPKAKPALFKGMPTKPKNAQWAAKGKFIDNVRYRKDGTGLLPAGNSQVYVLPIEGGTPRQLTFKEYPIVGSLAWNAEGTGLIIAINPSENHELEPFHGDLYLLDVASTELSQLTSMEGPERLPQLSPDGKYLAFHHINDRKLGFQHQDLWVLELKSGKLNNLTATFDRSVGQSEWASDSDSLFVSYVDHGKKRISEISLSGKKKNVKVELGGQQLGRPYTSGSFAISKSDSIVFTQGSSTRPADLSLITKRGKISQITQLNEDVLGHLTLSEAQEVAVKSSVDQREIQAWMVVPPDFDKTKKYPLILEIHGGPHTAYGPHFSAEIQLMAAQGYVVVWANPRGSSSYGENFGNLIHHNFPSNDYDDLMDSVDAVIAKGFIDTKNLFITGGSGGGLLSSWAVGKTNRFAAAVVAKPVINWMSFALTADSYPYFTRNWMPDLPWKIQDYLWSHSPLSLVGNVTTPTLLLTGEADHRTPISESEQFYQALKLQGVDAAMVRLPGASHGIASRPSRLIQKVGNILAWFERYTTKPEHMDD